MPESRPRLSVPSLVNLLYKHYPWETYSRRPVILNPFLSQLSENKNYNGMEFLRSLYHRFPQNIVFLIRHGNKIHYNQFYIRMLYLGFPEDHKKPNYDFIAEIARKFGFSRSRLKILEATWLTINLILRLASVGDCGICPEHFLFYEDYFYGWFQEWFLWFLYMSSDLVSYVDGLWRVGCAYVHMWRIG